MRNSPSRNDLNNSNNNTNTGSNNSSSVSSTSLAASLEDPEPLPIPHNYQNLGQCTQHKQSNVDIMSNNLKSLSLSIPSPIPVSISPSSLSSARYSPPSSSDNESSISSTSYFTSTSIPHSSINKNSFNSTQQTTLSTTKIIPKLSSIKEVDSGLDLVSLNPSNLEDFKNGSFAPYSPSTSPSSSNSNDLQFEFDLVPESKPLGLIPNNSFNSKLKQPPPTTKSTTSTTSTTTTTVTCSNIKAPSEKLKSSPSLTSSEKLKLKSSSSSSSTKTCDIDAIIEKLVAAGLSKKQSKYFPISNDDLKFICSKSRKIFMSQPMLLELASPVKIVGDIHGQFTDLLRIFKLCGFPPNSNYLFMGDYVDRGKQSLETMVLLLCLKIKYPENFFLLRGNHESANITKMYGFYDECKRRALNGVKLWKNFVDVFNTLPVAATIADKIFCVHGGLSPELKDLNQIKKIQRPTDIPDEGLLADLLWSDPQDNLFSKSSSGKSGKSSKSKSDWQQNDRGVSYCFNDRVVKNFCARFDFDLIARGHMVVEDGYEFYGNRRLVTIFSAPNYCGEFKNWGAVMNVNKKLMCSFELLKPKDKR